MMLDQVKNLSYQMRLFGIHQACERRAAEALAQQLHPLDFLRLAARGRSPIFTKHMAPVRVGDLG